MSQWQSKSFCNAPFITSAQELSGRFPAAFTSAQMQAALDLNTWDFRITAAQSIEDAQIDIIGAMGVLSMGTLAGLGIAVAGILGNAAQRNGVSGTMTRRIETERCGGVKFVYNFNLCYVEINFADVVRKQLGNSTIYYPRVAVIFYAAGMVFANDLQFLLGAGECVGAILIDGSSGAISTMYAVTGSGAPVGAPSCFGDIKPKESIDSLDFTPKSAPAGSLVTISGITFPTIEEVYFGDRPALFAQSSDKTTIEATVPTGARTDYIVMKGGDFTFLSRTPFIPT